MIASTWITKRYCKVKLFRFSQMAVGLLSVIMYFAVGPQDVVLAFVLFFLISFVVDLHAPIFWLTMVKAKKVSAWPVWHSVVSHSVKKPEWVWLEHWLAGCWRILNTRRAQSKANSRLPVLC